MNMKSPITGKEMNLVRDNDVKLEYRKDKFSVLYHYYLCEDSGEKFTDDNLNNINMQQRKKYKSIKKIRSIMCLAKMISKGYKINPKYIHLFK